MADAALRVMGLKPNGGNAPTAWFRRSRKPGPKGNVQICSVKNAFLIGSGRKRIHQDESPVLPLLGVDERNQPGEMRGPDAQGPAVQGSMIGTPAALKALASRVATAKPWAVAMAAI